MVTRKLKRMRCCFTRKHFAVLAFLFLGVGIYFWWSLPDVLLLTEEELVHRFVDEGNRPYPSDRSLPIVLWWTDFTHEQGAIKQCGDYQCYFTVNRSYYEHQNTKAFLWYGTDLKLDDLPLPRKPEHRWALLHEESPKNNWIFCHEKFMNLFNLTSTFNRYSDYPVTLQWLTSIQELESRDYYKAAEKKNSYLKNKKLAPIAYLQTDCGTASDRDSLVKALSEHVEVDSLGKCLHNKDLPDHLGHGLGTMEHKDLYELLSQYKFVMAAENAICNDYITEKFWRSFYVGTVPIVMGGSTIKDWLPTPGSAIVVDDYKDIHGLVKEILRYNKNPDVYDKALSYKTSGVTNKLLLDTMAAREWKIQNQGLSFIDGFECYVCKSLHERTTPNPKEDNTPHPRRLDCPVPSAYKSSVKDTGDGEFFYDAVYRDGQNEAEAAYAMLSEVGRSKITKEDIRLYVDKKVRREYNKKSERDYNF